jgi:hypothetical protein
VDGILNGLFKPLVNCTASRSNATGSVGERDERPVLPDQVLVGPWVAVGFQIQIS